jgi:transposase InsO family protein
LIIDMRDGEKASLEQIRAFLNASQEVKFEGWNRKEVYVWVTGLLRHHHYGRLGRADRGVVKQYLEKMTGLGRAQMTRLVGRYLETGEVSEASYQRRSFPRIYTPGDIGLLAGVDEAHDVLSGPATKKILEREFKEYGHSEYERLAEISASHIYNLRRSNQYRKRYMAYHATRPAKVGFGERRRPEPNGRPGYLRIDTVHQGDKDKKKGVYHINAVDEVTQWEVVAAAPHISEYWLLPVLELMLDEFPFQVLGMHSDNGGEFINEPVSRLLGKLLIEQTKSRPRRSNDNGMIESKNGAIVRKHIGHGYIAAEHADLFMLFYRDFFNPYLNYHRPCGQPVLVTDSKGKERRTYKTYATPWEIFRDSPNAASFLRAGLTMEQLQRQAMRESDTECARRMQAEKAKLFESIARRA